MEKTNAFQAAATALTISAASTASALTIEVINEDTICGKGERAYEVPEYFNLRATEITGETRPLLENLTPTLTSRAQRHFGTFFFGENFVYQAPNGQLFAAVQGYDRDPETVPQGQKIDSTHACFTPLKP